jgi:hypothetical protein
MMKQLHTNINSDHQELSQLLPWFVNKTLQGTELKAVENHLAVCLMCKRELNQLQKLAQAVTQDGALDSAEKASFARLKMRLHGVEELSPTQQATGSSNVRQFSKPDTKVRISTAWMRPALAMAAAVLLLVTLVMPLSVEKLGNDFRTLSDGQIEKVSANANEIRVVFAENIDQQQKDTILERVHGQIIDDPTAQGVYTVRLERDIAANHLLDVVDLLRKDSKVIFAEPAYALLSSMHTED